MKSGDGWIEAFRPKSKWPDDRPGLALCFTLPVALEILDRCGKDGYAILGIDGLIVDAESMRGPIELILDCSIGLKVPAPAWQSVKDECNGAALHFLQDYVAQQEKKLAPGEEILLELHVVSEDDAVALRRGEA